MSEPRVDVTMVPVNKTGRFLLVVRPVFALSEPTRARVERELERLQAGLEEWWASGKKFGVALVDPYVQVLTACAEDEEANGTRV